MFPCDPSLSCETRNCDSCPIAKLEVNGVVLETKAVQPDDKEIVFITRLDSGSHRLAPTFVDSDGNEVGAYYTIVDSLP